MASDKSPAETQQAPRPRRRWLQFSVRTVVILIAALSVWLGLRVNAARRQRAAVAAIHSLGGRVHYDFQFKRSVNGREFVDPKSPLPYPDWLGPLAERVMPPRVFSVSLRDTAATDRDLELLRSLPHIRNLDLARTNITDKGLEIVGRQSQLRSLTLLGPKFGDDGVSHLRHLRLERLSLWKTTVTDRGVRHLREMTTLQNLVLDETRITDGALEDVGQLTNLEEWLGLTHTQVTDAGLVHLTRLKKLKVLNLIGTTVSPKGVRTLRQELPDASISPLW